MNDFRVHIIPILNDNYVFCIEYLPNKKCILIDPGEYAGVHKYLIQFDLEPEIIFITHHHLDHIGGISEFKKNYDVKIYGNINDSNRLPNLDIKLKKSDYVYWNDIDFEILSLDGHTIGHIGYYSKKLNSLFCGDTLFSLGCGRLFEGTATQMWDSLNLISQLPDETLIYCTHEYTLANGKFAQYVDPNNIQLKIFLEKVKVLVKKGKPSIPVILKDEKLINPFLRPDVIEFETLNLQKATSTAENFATLRKLKDHF